MADVLAIRGKISDKLEFNFSTADPNSKGLLTFESDEGSVALPKHYFIHLSREEMKKLRDTLNAVLDFTSEESENEIIRSLKI